MSNRIKSKISKFWALKSEKVKKRVTFAMAEAKRIIEEEEKEKSIKNQEKNGNKVMTKENAVESNKGK